MVLGFREWPTPLIADVPITVKPGNRWTDAGHGRQHSSPVTKRHLQPNTQGGEPGTSPVLTQRFMNAGLHLRQH